MKNSVSLRTLILSEEDKKGVYDLSKVPWADFGQLIEDGSIRIAARDIYKGSFSENLRDVQKSKKFVDKPSEQPEIKRAVIKVEE